MPQHSRQVAGNVNRSRRAPLWVNSTGSGGDLATVNLPVDSDQGSDFPEIQSSKFLSTLQFSFLWTRIKDLIVRMFY